MNMDLKMKNLSLILTCSLALILASCTDFDTYRADSGSHDYRSTGYAHSGSSYRSYRSYGYQPYYRQASRCTTCGYSSCRCQSHQRSSYSRRPDYPAHSSRYEDRRDWRARQDRRDRKERSDRRDRKERKKELYDRERKEREKIQDHRKNDRRLYSRRYNHPANAKPKPVRRDRHHQRDQKHERRREKERKEDRSRTVVKNEERSEKSSRKNFRQTTPSYRNVGRVAQRYQAELRQKNAKKR